MRSVASFDEVDRMLGPVPSDVVNDLRTIDTVGGSEPLSRDRFPGLFASLADRARVTSIEASSALDGVVVEHRTRAAEIVAGRVDHLRDPDEQELAGYRAVFDYLDGDDWRPFDVDLLLHVHRLLFQHTSRPGGHLRHSENLVVDRQPAGTHVKRYTPVPATSVPTVLDELVVRHRGALDSGAHHPVLLTGLLALDLLAIHPFAAANGRVVRVLTNALLRDAGYGVTRYVSLEATMARSAETYSSALLGATHDWHLGRHDPWPWLRYFTHALADVSAQLATLTSTARRGGGKQDRVRDHVLRDARGRFRISEIRTALPDVSDQTIRLVLAQLKAEHLIQADGVGRGATWSRTARRSDG